MFSVGGGEVGGRKRDDRGRDKDTGARDKKRGIMNVNNRSSREFWKDPTQRRARRTSKLLMTGWPRTVQVFFAPLFLYSFTSSPFVISPLFHPHLLSSPSPPSISCPPLSPLWLLPLFPLPFFFLILFLIFFFFSSSFIRQVRHQIRSGSRLRVGYLSSPRTRMCQTLLIFLGMMLFCACLI